MSRHGDLPWQTALTDRQLDIDMSPYISDPRPILNSLLMAFFFCQFFASEVPERIN